MKKAMISFLLAAVLITSGTISVFAAGRGKNYTDAHNNCVCDCKQNTGYVDSNNDGICDNFGTSGNCSFTHKNSNCASGYVDSDNNGICDNFDTSNNRVRPQNGTGNQHGKNR